MTLHEAIIKVLLQHGRAMTTQEIADVLNQNKWYVKADGSPITAFQIHGRTRNYSNLFNRNGSVVSLKSKTEDIPPATVSASSIPKPRKLITADQQSDELALKVLMNENNVKPANSIQHLIPNQPGLYCIRINQVNKLPEPFATHLKNRNHNILYIGIATTSLRQRLGQELWAEGHGTFFRGLGAVLGYRPPKGSLLHSKNKNNYKFSITDQNQIIQWINNHLLVNWVSWNGNFTNTETWLINTYIPLMNTAKNPAKLPELAALRNECRKIANSL
ncbi:MAG TPA: hypothetical protein PKE03_12540 [Bacteroidales bacterium]|nr:hypothetical protein [Bacteroidales bacterium]